MKVNNKGNPMVFTSRSNKILRNMKSGIKKTRKGDDIIFTRIKVKNNLGKIYNLDQSIVITLN